MTITRHLLIHGRVQGVGFRWSLCAEAKMLELAGWVRNRRDGTVEALIQGPLATVDALTKWARHGPTAASVDHVDSIDIPSGEAATMNGFEKHPTF